MFMSPSGRITMPAVSSRNVQRTVRMLEHALMEESVKNEAEIFQLFNELEDVAAELVPVEHAAKVAATVAIEMYAAKVFAA